MNCDEIKYWLDRYNKEEYQYNTGLEEETRKRFYQNGHMSKSDLLKIIEWKFITMPGREKRLKNLLKNADETLIVYNSHASFESKEDFFRIKSLYKIPGVGPALASTILAFFDPKRYGICDVHSRKSLMKKKQPTRKTYKYLADFLKVLRDEAQDCNMDCRDVEKAYFKKDKEEPQIF